MKVKCINIHNIHTREDQSTSPWLTIGKEYVVLGIEVRYNETNYLIASDAYGSPGMHRIDQFEIISKKIPKSWKIISDTMAIVTLEPESWHVAGFWDACYDGDSQALEIYKREVRKIYEEEGIF